METPDSEVDAIAINYPSIKIMLAPRVICIHNLSEGEQVVITEEPTFTKLSCDKHTYYGFYGFYNTLQFQYFQ